MNTAGPIIGLSCRFDVSARYRGRDINSQNTSYIRAVQAAGGTPFLIPLDLPENGLRRLFDLSDGILLSGGGDINPVHYNEEQHPTVGGVQDERDRTEMLLSYWATAENKPLLGICRGFQVMGVAAGGSMVQDILSQLDNVQRHNYTNIDEKPRDYYAHRVKLERNSRLAAILETTDLAVNSLHHQALKVVPKPFQVTGYADDGIIEVIEVPEHRFCLGVQWHPEELYPTDDAAKRIFTAFVDACVHG